MTEDDLYGRLSHGVQRKEVVVGGDKLFRLAKQKKVGVVVSTSSLSRHAARKLKIECATFGIPYYCIAEQEKLGERSGVGSAKVYILKKSMSGLAFILRELESFSQDDD
jgi:ribosomal protein L7Ae-like RNA K-turn-binding protein